MSNSKQIVIYEGDDGSTQLAVNLQEDTIWLAQKHMAELFEKDVRTINEHLKNVYKTGELVKKATILKFRIVQIKKSE